MQQIAEIRSVPYQNKKKIYATDILIAGILFLVLFRGFIENFLGHGTLYVDFCFGILTLWSLFICINGGVFKTFRGRILLKYIRLYIFWIVLCAIVCAFQAWLGRTSVYGSVIEFRNNCLYTGLFFISAITLNLYSIKSFYSFFINLGVLICSFAIIQYLFRNFLPDSLLFLNDEGNFGFYGRDAIRVTGLMGNTIIFSGFTIVLFSLVWAQILAENCKINGLWIKFAIVAIANFLTFSRSSIVGMVAVFVLEIFLQGVAKKNIFKTLLVICSLLLIIIFLALTIFRDTIIIKRLIDGDNLWNSGSNAGHFSMIQEAIEEIKENWLFGKSNEIITDGAIWAYMLEMGIPVFVVYCILIIALILFAIKNCRSANKTVRTLAFGYIAMNAYFIVSSFINSAYAARSVLVFIWFIGGMLLAAVANFKFISKEQSHLKDKI